MTLALEGVTECVYVCVCESTSVLSLSLILPPLESCQEAWDAQSAGQERNGFKRADSHFNLNKPPQVQTSIHPAFFPRSQLALSLKPLPLISLHTLPPPLIPILSLPSIFSSSPLAPLPCTSFLFIPFIHPLLPQGHRPPWISPSHTHVHLIYFTLYCFHPTCTPHTPVVTASHQRFPLIIMVFITQSWGNLWEITVHANLEFKPHRPLCGLQFFTLITT